MNLIIETAGQPCIGQHDHANRNSGTMLALDFRPASPAYIAMLPTGAGIIPDRPGLDIGNAEGTKLVGVFSNESSQNIITRIVNFKLAAVRLDGDEPPTQIDNLRLTVKPEINPDILFIKTIVVRSGYDLSKATDYTTCADFLMFEQDCAACSGNEFAALLKKHNSTIPFYVKTNLNDTAIKAIGNPMLTGRIREDTK